MDVLFPEGLELAIVAIMGVSSDEVCATTHAPIDYNQGSGTSSRIKF